MDNNPKSYRAPEVHLSDILPTKKKVDVQDSTQKTVRVLTEEDLDPHVEAEKLQQEFIERTQEELQKMMEGAPKKEEFEDIGIQFIEQKSSNKTPKNIEKIPVEKGEGGKEIENDEKDSRLPQKAISKEPTVPKNSQSMMPVVEEPTLQISKNGEEVVQRVAIKEGQETSPKEKTNTVNPLPQENGSQENAEEIADLFDTYLEKNAVKEVPVTVKKERPLIPPPLPDPLDIWEQDATTHKIAIDFKKKESIPKLPIQQEVVQENNQKSETSYPSGMGLGRVSTPTLSEKKKEEGTQTTIDILTLPKNEGVQDFSHFLEEKHEQENTSANSNLAELRARIAKAHSESKEGEKNVLNTNEEMQVLENEGSELHSRVSEKLQILNTQANTDQGERVKPQSKHASVLSDVANRLHSISVGEEIRTPKPPQDSDMDEGSLDMQPNENIEEKTQIETPTPPPVPENSSQDEAIKTTPGELRGHTPPPPKTSGLSLIRTFRNDVEQAVAKNKTSVVGMLTAEQNRIAQTPVQPPVAKIRTAKKPMATSLVYIFTIASILLVIGALGIGSFLLYSYLTSDISIQQNSITTTNKSVSYTITDRSRIEALQELTRISSAVQVSLGSLVEIELLDRSIKAIEGSEGVLNTKASARTVMTLFAPNAPESLIRSLVDPLLLGVHEMPEGNMPFLILKVDHKDVGFRGMFDWEEKMNADLEPLFGPLYEKKVEEIKNEVIVTQNSTTSSSTEMVVPRKTVRYEKIQFEDSFIANKEIRGLKDDSGTFILLWTMPDEKTILITTNEVTMRVILEKIATLSK